MIREIEQYTDKIIFTDRDRKGCNDWRKSRRWEDLKKERHFFPLNNFILDMQYKKSPLICLVELKDFNPVSYMRVTTDRWELIESRRGNGWDTTFRMTDGTSWNNDKVAEDYASVVHAEVLSICLYIEYKAKEKKRQLRLSPDMIRKEREEYQYKERECFFSDDIIEYVKLHPTRSSLQYRCECWGVRGHFRHLSVGNVIFIKPYLKGKKRGIIEPKSKDYLIEKEDKHDNTDMQ